MIGEEEDDSEIEVRRRKIIVWCRGKWGFWWDKVWAWLRTTLRNIEYYFRLMD